MAKEDKKVFDVAKPGESKSDIGSKPMIIGHKSLASDPMMSKELKNEKEVEATKDSTPAPSMTAKKIEPLTEEEKATENTQKPEDIEKVDKSETKEPVEDNDDENSTESGGSDKEKAPDTEEESDKPEKEIDGESETDGTEEATQAKKKEEKIDPNAAAMEREDNLKKIIESKKYFLDIKEKKSGSARSFFVAFFGFLLIGFALLYVLIDMEIIDIDYDLPFRIFGE